MHLYKQKARKNPCFLSFFVKYSFQILDILQPDDY